MNRDSLYVLGVPVDLLSWDEAVNRLVTWGGARLSAVVCICNVHMTVTAGLDPLLGKILVDADMVTPDGAPLAWSMRRAGFSSQQRINGPDLMWRYLKEAEKFGQVVFFFGGQEETLARLKIKMLTDFPELKIGGMISPPFGEISSEEDRMYVEHINAQHTSVLFVGLGCPKQEKWMESHRGRIQAVMVGVGAAFDYHAGTIKRAPVWMQNCGLEWLYRLCSEPRRLWKRYLFTNTIFIVGMIKNGFRAKKMVC